MNISQLSFITSHILHTFRTSPSRLALRNLSTTCSKPRFSSTAETPAKLITPAWLSTHLHANPDTLTVLDVRGRVEKTGGRVEHGLQAVEYVADDDAYYNGHIPGAVFVDWRAIDIARHEDLCELLSRCGVEKTQPICVYDWGNMLFATRLWYALVCMGCSDVRVLDGGWREWDEHGGDVSLDTYCPLKNYSELETPFEEHEVPPGTVPLQSMRRIVAERSSVLIDARSVRQFTGMERRAARAGHIPGAVNVPYRSLLCEDGTGLRADGEVRAVLQDAGLLRKEQERACCVTYCNGGVASTLVLFCLVRCGMELNTVRNYCGSIGEWANLEDTPLDVMT